MTKTKMLKAALDLMSEETIVYLTFMVLGMSFFLTLAASALIMPFVN